MLSPEEVREDIPFLKKYVYFDNGATTPVPRPVQEAMLGYFNDYLANIERGAYSVAHHADEMYEKARENAARLLLNASPEEFIFTRNLTQGANIVAYALEHPLLTTTNEKFGPQEPLIKWEEGDRIIGTVLEHHSNTMPWIRLSVRVGARFEIVPPGEDMLLSPDIFAEKVDRKTKLVVFQHVSNALGSIHPVKEITRAIKDVNPECLVFVDGSQGPGHMPVDVKEIGCDFYGFSGHKGPLGPQGTGGLYVREGLIEKMEPMEVGGGMMADVTENTYKIRADRPAKKFDAGTPNIVGMIGLGRAAEYVAKDIGLENIDGRERFLAGKIIEGIKDLPGIEIYGPAKLENRGGVVAFNVEGWRCHDISAALDQEWKILTRSGHHCCLPLSRYLGILEKYGGSARASVGYYNLEDEVKLFVEAMETLTEA